MTYIRAAIRPPSDDRIFFSFKANVKDVTLDATGRFSDALIFLVLVLYRVKSVRVSRCRQLVLHVVDD